VKCPHCGHEFEPLTLDGAKKKGRTKMTFASWMKSIQGSEAIPEGHHALRYADTAGIPREFIALAWEAFCRNYRSSTKLYSDWPAAFRKALEGNWFRLWFMSDTGAYQLSTVGKQLQRATQQQGQHA